MGTQKNGLNETVPLSTQKNGLNETFLLSTQTTCSVNVQENMCDFTLKNIVSIDLWSTVLMGACVFI